MASRYQQGRDKEYKAIADLAAMGYGEALRAAQSRGKADVVAWNSKAIRFVQVKGYQDRPGAFTKDIVQMMNMQLPPYASAELWLRQTGKSGWVERILIRHTHPEMMDLPSLDDLGREQKFTVNINPDVVTEHVASLKKAAKEWKARKTSPSPRTARSSSASPTTETPVAGKTVDPPSEQAPAISASSAEPPPAVVSNQEWC